MTKGRPGRPFQRGLIGVLENLANRGYTDGFYQRHHTHEHKNYITGYSISHQQQFCGEITDYDDSANLAIVDVKNKFSIGDRFELISPQGNQDILMDRRFDMDGHTLNEAPGGSYRVKIAVPTNKTTNGLLARYID